MGKTPKIIVIDDETLVTDSVQKIIQTKLGWEVDTANHPNDGLEKLKKSKSLFGFGKNKYDGAIIDIKMPDKTGLELIEEWRKIEGKHKLPIILLSAYEDESKWKKATDIHVSAYLNKPIKSTALVKTLEKVILNEDVESTISELKEQSYDKIHELKNAKEYKDAHDMQQNLIPKEAPKIPGVEVNMFFRPAKFVGGDFFTYFELPNNKLGIAMVDIIGKGIPACMSMMRLREILHRYIEPNATPKSFISKLNNLIVEDDTFKKGAPIFFGILDKNNNKFTYVNTMGNAGGLHMTIDKTVTELTEGGFMIGADPDEPYEEGEVTLNPGDLLLLFTDGIVEQTNAEKQQYDLPNLVNSMKRFEPNTGNSLSNHVYKELETYMNGVDHDDDTTIIDIEIR